MDDIRNQRYKKQTFLRTEILEQGFDTSKFQNFMNNSKENGSNIDYWDFDELKDMVQLFKDSIKQRQNKLIEDLLNADYNEPQISDIQSSQKSESQNNQQKKEFQQNQQNDIDQNIILQTLSSQENETKEQTQTQNNQTQVKNQEQFTYQEQEYQNKVYGVKLYNSLFNSTEDINITINQFNLIQGGIFYSAYYEYNIVTSPFGWQVKRRFSDFVWLKNTFARLFPATIIPPLPIKKMKVFDDTEAQKRVLFYEKFLQNCLKQPLIRYSRPMHEFLYVTDDKNFKNRIKECDKIPKPMNLNEFNDINGNLQCKISQKIENYCQATDEFVNTQEQYYKKLKKLSKQLSQQFGQVTQSLQKISEVFFLMNKSTDIFNNNIEIGKNKYLQDFYLQGALMTSDWSDCFSRQSKTIEKDLHQFMKYKEKEMSGIKDIMKLRNIYKFDYLKMNKSLTIKKKQLIENCKIIIQR